MNKNQKIAAYNLLGYIAAIIFLIGLTFISIGVSTSIDLQDLQQESIATSPAEWGRILSGCYYVRGYCWGQYAFDLQSKLYQLGYSENDTIIIINNCKKQGKLGNIKNVGQCIRTAGMIGFVESSAWRRCYNNNCMGLYSGRKAYKDKDEMFKDWISRYIKYWYNHPYPYEYYGAKPLTRYCTDGNMHALHNAEYAYKVLNSN